MIGDRVAAIAAETREAAEEAARLVTVEYEELPVVPDAIAALAPDAPVIHPGRDGYIFNGKEHLAFEHPNQCGIFRSQRGADIGTVFATAPHLFRHRFRTARQHAGYLEPKATVVWIDPGGTIHVHTPNKAPFGLRAQIAKIAEVVPENVVIEPAAIGGDFGSKGYTSDEFPCYFLAKATGRPIKRVSSYTNELTYAATKHPTHTTLETAVDKDGTFLAHRMQIIYDGGAYAGAKPFMMPGQNGCATIPYYIPSVEIDVMSVYTNTAPGTHVRAPGNTQQYFAWEQHVDLIANALGIDTITLRRRNLIREGQPAVADEIIDQVMGDAVLARLSREMPTPPTGCARPGAWLSDVAIPVVERRRLR